MVKNLPAKAGGAGSVPGSGRSPVEGNDNPVQYSCLGNPMDRGAWWAMMGVTESDTTDQPTLSFSDFIKITWVFRGAGAVLSAQNPLSKIDPLVKIVTRNQTQPTGSGADVLNRFIK